MQTFIYSGNSLNNQEITITIIWFWSLLVVKYTWTAEQKQALRLCIK